MFTKSAIDMSRPHTLYGAGLGVLMLTSVALSNLPLFTFSDYVTLTYRKEICAGLFVSGAVMGCLALLRHRARARNPWQVPQSQITVPYVAFFLLTLAAILIAR